MINQASTNPLLTLPADIGSHWRQYCPRRVADLEQQGELLAAVATAAQMTEEAVIDAVSRGMDFWQAWAMHRQTWAFAPPEDGPEAYGADGAHDDTWMVGWQPEADIDDDPEDRDSFDEDDRDGEGGNDE